MIVMYFSRQREFRADAGAAKLLGSPQPMIAALHRLGGIAAGELPQNVATAGIAGRPGWMALFSSHPPIEERIAALR
jgi:heat shock protein HtpX